MWSDGGVEGLKEPLFGGGVAPREAVRHLWGSSSRFLDQTADDQVSSSTSPSQEEAAVDLSLKSQVESSEAVLDGRRPFLQSATLMKGNTQNFVEISGNLRRISSDDEGNRLVIVEPSSHPESSCSPPPPPNSTTSATLTEQREFSSFKEVLLEMTNRKNGAKLPPARWGIMKKDADQVLLKVPKYIVDEKKGAFPRPTALVNPFPADALPINGSATLQTSITDWLQGKKANVSPREVNKTCSVPKTAKNAVRQRIPKGSNGKVITSRKKPLTTIVAQLAGSIQSSQPSPSLQTDPGILQKLLAPSDSVTFSSSHRLSGGEVSISEITPDISVVDRLKRLGTVIELEDQAESNSLKLLEKMTKSVTTDGEITQKPVQIPTSQPLKLPLMKQQSSAQQLKHNSQTSKKQSSKNQSAQLTLSNQISPQTSKINLSQVPSEQSHQYPESDQNQSIKGLPSTSGSQQFAEQIPNQQNSSTPQSHSSKIQSTNSSNQVQVVSSQVPKVQSTISPKTQPNIQTIKTSPISLTPKVQLTIKSNKKINSRPTNKHQMKLQHSKAQGTQTPVKQLSADTPLPITVPLFISKDVTLIPKLPSEPVQEKIEPSLLEPVIDIVEEENILSQDGTFLFKIDSYYNVDLPNEQKVYSCDICSAVYTHSNMLRKHYLRLHISRKYISEKDMETFNIDHEPVNEKEEEKLIFRCHTCRECFPTKSDLRSHLTDHPPVVELVKQNNKSHPSYKCENCLSFFKWRKQFGKHKKACKPSPPPPSEKPDLFHCLYCNETFLNGNTKRNHILSNHPYVRRKHCCVFCKRDGFPTNVSLFLHLLNDHPTVYFACQICKERFSNLEELKAHADKRHDQDDKLKSSLSERVSTLKQEKDYYSCDTCQRKFLVESSFKEHICFPEKLEKPKPKLQKIKKKVYPLSERLEKSSNRNVDLETLFYSRVAGNVRDNLLHHLDGKIYQDEPSEEDQNYDGAPSPNVSTRTFLNFSAGFPSSSEIQMDHSGAETPTRVKAPWEKYTFPKNYDGRCGLTSYIKDTSYLDISTQLIMRRNLQRLNMLPMKESPSDDVPSVLALERLSAECAESFGQLKKEKREDDGDETQELGSLSGEWVRERMYVCSACRWESPCLWTMEDHKYIAHPRVHCPQHELIGDQTSLSKTIYKRLVTEVPNPYKGPSPPTPPSLSSISCTKCSKTGFSNQTELHVHILECAGVVVEAIGPVSSSRRRRRRTRRRPRRGLKRNIPSTPQKPPPKQRTKPGDTDTIQRMIANLPAKRVSRKVFSGYEDDKAKLNQVQKSVAPKGGKNKKTPGGKRSQSEPPRTPVKEEPSEDQVMLKSPTVIKKEQDYIDTSAEGGDVLSSLRMMPVRSARTLNGLVHVVDTSEKKDIQLFGQSDDKEMPKLEIEKDISPVESSEIPVLSPVERKDDIKKEKEDLICGISFVDGVIKYETVSSVSQETEKLSNRQKQRKRKSSVGSISPGGPKTKKSCKSKDESQIPIRRQIKEEPLSPVKDLLPKEILVKEEVSEKENIEKKEVSPKETISKKDILPKEAIGKKVSPSKESTGKKKIVATDKKSSSPKDKIGKRKISPKKTPLKKTISPKKKTEKKNMSPKESIDKNDSLSKEIICKNNISTMENTNTEETNETAKNDTVSPKRRGRPKGSLTRKLDVPEKRRSNRRSTKEDISLVVKFDEILPCEEDEEEVIKKPEKPKRKPRTVKEPPAIDLTTIVVQAEVHPVPVLKRKATEICSETPEAESDLPTKKIKEISVDELHEEEKIAIEKSSSENVIEEKNPSVVANVDATVDVPAEPTVSIEPAESSCENEASLIEPDTSAVEEQDTQSFESNSIEKVIERSEEINEEAVVTTSVNDNQLNFPTSVNDNQLNKDVNSSQGLNNNEYTKNTIEIYEFTEDISLGPNEVNEISEDQKLNGSIIDISAVDLTENTGKRDTVEVGSSQPVVSSECDSEIPEKESITVDEVNEKIPEETSLLSEEKPPLKKKKTVKKIVIKTKKKKKDESKCENRLIQEQENNTEQLLIVEKSDDNEKCKKIKKHTKKEINESLEPRKIKKAVKKKKVIKKIVKLKKRFPNKSQSDTRTGEVLKIAGFKWEVSELKSLPVKESSIVEPEPVQSLPDSSVQEPIPDQQVPGPPLNNQSLPHSVPSQQQQQSQTSLSQQQSSLAESPSSVVPPAPLPPQGSASLQLWETPSPWEQVTPDPSLGTIIDSVNKLLSEPESTYTPLGLPSYSLADLQKAMGASDDEMAVLQQLGEASLQITSNEGSCSGSIKGCEGDDWNGEKCIMDLDSQSTLPKEPEPSVPVSSVTPSPTPGIVKEESQEWRWREKSPSSVGSSSLLEAHQGKEVLCPACTCHFMGFPALQKHLAKEHPDLGPKSKQKRGSGTTFTKTDLNRRMPLDTSQSPRLVCFSCQQILPADRMSLHLEQEHGISPEEVSKCSSLSGEAHDGPVIGERLKSKMSSKLGDLLDRAVNNLLQAKHKPNNTLSGGAVELLTKLCAVRKREGSVKHRLHGARELLSKLQRQQDQNSLDQNADDSTKVVKPIRLFSCSVCGLKFSVPSSRNKHEVLAHRSYSRPAEYEVDEYENDWREAPSPPEVKGENGAESAIFPQCSDCGLSFDTIQEMMRHRVEDHATRRTSVDASNSNTGCCPSPVPSSGGSRSLPDSEAEVGGGDSDAGSGRRRKSTRKLRLSQSGSKSVKERAEAALRELNHPRQRTTEKRWLTSAKQKSADIYNFTDESL